MLFSDDFFYIKHQFNEYTHNAYRFFASFYQINCAFLFHDTALGWWLADKKFFTGRMSHKYMYTIKIAKTIHCADNMVKDTLIPKFPREEKRNCYKLGTKI